MKWFTSILCLVIVIASALADTGYYVPKAFYTIDTNGNPSPLYYLNGPAQHLRHRRAAQFAPGFGFPQPIFPNFGLPSLFPQIGIGAGTGSFSSVSTATTSNTGGGSGGGIGLDSRFGEDEPPKVVGTATHTVTNNNGQFTQTTSHLQNGQVHHTIQSGKF